MKTVIYLDELLLTNFLAAAALLLGSGLLCARQCSGLRLMAGSAAAAAASLGILLPELPGPAAFLYKVFTCCAAVAAAYGVPGLRNFVQLCVWYLLLNLLLCGAVLLPGVQSANLCVYLPLSPGRLLLCCGAVLAVLRGWEGELRRANAAGTQEAFDLLRGQFQSLADEREKAQQTASAALEAAFDFMEQAFAESQEMVVFVTELTVDPVSHAFLTENGCERYFQYNKDLLLDHRKAALQQELAAEQRRHGGV